MQEQTRRCVVTGSAGFIGYHLVLNLLENGFTVLGLDSLNTYYDLNLKKARLSALDKHMEDRKIEGLKYQFIKLDLNDTPNLIKLVKEFEPDTICHLAAQPGVLYSIENPQSYVNNNLLATVSVLEAAKECNISDIVFASTSSVYGNSKDVPFKEHYSIDSPLSIYAATKRACELACYTYNDMYGIRFRILRFFTVYGSFGRPDMMPIKFARLMVKGEPIEIYNYGKMRRDFTYVDDIVAGIVASIQTPLDFEIINLGSGSPVELLDFVDVMESSLGVKSVRKMQPIKPGEMVETWADISKARHLLHYKPKVSLSEGIPRFVEWFIEFYEFKGVKQ